MESGTRPFWGGVVMSLLGILLLAGLWGCTSSQPEVKEKSTKEEGKMVAERKTPPVAEAEEAKGDDGAAFVQEMTAKLQPMEKAWAEGQWKAYTTGKKEDFDDAAAKEMAVKEFLGDKEAFAKVKAFRQSKPADPLLARQLDTLYNRFLPNQIPKELMQQIVTKSSEAERIFGTSRGKIDGKEVTSNEISRILGQEKDQELRKKAWEASKDVGQALDPVLKDLIKLRNQAAKSLGFEDYYVMALAANDQKVGEILQIFDDLAKQTDQPFAEAKAEVDQFLARKFGIKIEELMPWHYEDPFFQEAPAIYGLDQDEYLKDKDPKEIVTVFFKSLGMDPEAVLARSDLYEREGKNPHAFCFNIDRMKDVRILANLKSNTRWTSTLLHEMGHAVYELGLDTNLPYLLREPAHIFTTEGIAQLMEGGVEQADFMATYTGLPEEKKAEFTEKAKKARRLQLLVFCRWTEVMVHFERALYQDPEGDHNKRWWEMVERYQGIKAPPGRSAPDWAAKAHFSAAPAYYHNYMLGHLFLAQLKEAMAKEAGLAGPDAVTFIDQPALGTFLVEKVFKPGARVRWDQFVRESTGQDFSPAAFVRRVSAL